MNTVPAEENPEEAIAAMRRGMVESYNSGDLEGLLSHVDEEIHVTWQNGDVTNGKEELRAYHLRMLSGPAAIVKKLTCDPVVDGRNFQQDWAVSWGRMNDHFVLNDGRDLPLDSRFTATIARRGEAWKIVAFHVSVNVFDNPILKLSRKFAGIAAGAGGFIVGALAGWFGAQNEAGKFR